MDDRLQGDFVYRWTRELTQQLILWRVANKNLFTGKRNAARKGFEVFIKQMGLEGKVSVASVKKKWENLKQKYKELKNQPNGGSTHGGVTADTWTWYRAMDEALEFSHSITCVTVGSSSAADDTVFSVPSEGKAAASSSCLNSTATSNSCLNSTAASKSCLNSTAASKSCLNSTATSNSCFSPTTASGSSDLVFLQQYEQVNAPIAVQDLQPIATGYVLKWTDELIEQLILWRVANKNLFTGKRNAARKGFQVFIKEMELEGKVTVASVKKKWENLKQKYKELKNPSNGGITQGGVTADTWKWYRAMDEALEFSHSITCLTVGSSSAADGTVFSVPSEGKAAASSSCLNSTAASNSSLSSTAASSSCFSSTTASSSCTRSTATSVSCFTSTAISSPSFSSTAPEPPTTSPAPKRAKKEPEWLLAIKELERREEARDARQAEWERAMMEREKRRDREMMEREERRDQEMKEREERRDRELREREERLIAENREREDRQAKEAAAREERFLALMDFLVKK
ncbi:cell wall protein AWA1-like isoform X2 [Anguilla anguilla]|uniref:cell wall protein AWA1-like isoform X2 n=1 Tax=Anguilla anguilla TaxID=7936 RepID=UPI0015AB7A2F|nr:cell wall protein AWA1-like isoform X2 [Anguilla anguilla]